MSDEQGKMGVIARRLGIIAFAAMVALLGARELQNRHQNKNKGVGPSHVTALLRGDIDFTKPKLAETVEERAALKREHTEGEDQPKTMKETLRGWVNKLLQ